MTVLADYVVILRNETFPVAATHGTATVTLPGKWSTGGRWPGGNAIFMYAVRGLAGSAEMWINNGSEDHVVGLPGGQITSTASATRWETQMLMLGADHLNGSGGNKNTLFFKNVTDDFEIRTIVCFFHQEV